MSWKRGVRQALRGALAVVLLAGTLVSGAAESTAEGAEGAQERRSYTGTIDGADYRVEVPEQWNGTLLLYSHGYWPVTFPPPPEVALTNSEEAEGWLLDHGYALAASNFKGVSGYQVEQGYHDQLVLLDWFEDHVGEPSRTVATGQSLGATIAVLLAERNPDRFDGVSTVCGGYDPQGIFNVSLDMNFAVKTLLAPDHDIELVRPNDAEGSTQALADAITEALTTPEGRARLALVASLNNVTGWYRAHHPQPTDRDERIENQAAWLLNAYTIGLGPNARVDLEARAGGNPSFNVGVDYRRQLARSNQTELVEEAYGAAGLDLDADLDRLNAAPRIAPDRKAVDFMYRYGVPTGRTPVPVTTLHTVGDGGAIPGYERWYGDQVRRAGDSSQLRQFYVDRGGHCSVSAADEITVLKSLLEKIDTGRWPNTSPGRFNATADGFDPEYQQVVDLGGCDETGACPKEVMPPAFTRFTPPKFQRPSR